MEKISYKLDVFEGPLDLLLHLISKHKLNINDIPILMLIEQYLDYVRQMQETMEVASEFLEMAARLIYIKTVSLLPVHEEAEELKKELTGELSDYYECQLMAGKLKEKADGFDYIAKSPSKIEKDMSYTRIHEPLEILSAYISAIGRGKRKLPPPVEAFSGIVAHKIVSVESRITAVVDRLKSHRKRKLISFFEDATSKSELVATFLALLSLAKDKIIRIDGDGAEMEIVIVEDEGVENS